MKIVKKITLLIALAALSLTASAVVAQEVGTDVVSLYVWRGLDQGGGVALQPSFALDLSPVSVGAWGSYDVTGSGVSEVDLSVGFDLLGWAKVTVTDYYLGGEVLDFDEDAGVHQLEVSADTDLLYGTLSANLFVYGDDDNSVWLDYELDLGQVADRLSGIIGILGGGNGSYTSTGDPALVLVGLEVGNEKLSASYLINVDTEQAWLIAAWSL